jgi:hypothetical protein
MKKPKFTDLGAKNRKGTDLGAEKPKCWRRKNEVLALKNRSLRIPTLALKNGKGTTLALKDRSVGAGKTK